MLGNKDSGNDHDLAPLIPHITTQSLTLLLVLALDILLMFSGLTVRMGAGMLT